MATLRDIRKRIESIRSTQTITRTMRMVAAAKLRKAQDAALNNRAYSKRMTEIMGGVVLRTLPESHPMLEPREIKRVLLIVVSSDRGLCGAFNLNLLSRVDKFFEENQGKYQGISLYAIGKKARNYFKRRNREIINELVDIKTLEHKMIDDIKEDLIAHYKKGECDKILVAYNRFHSVMRQEVILEDLFPIKPPEVPKFPVEYLFEPSQSELLDQFIPAYIKAQVYKTLLESQASEHAARMNAMENATSNCGELISNLTLVYNKTRQANITKEMMDIVGGAEALRA